MSYQEHDGHVARRLHLLLALGFCMAVPLSAQVPAPNPDGPRANWAFFEKYSPTALRGAVYSTTATPKWIGESDSLFYNWRDSKGDHWWLAIASSKVKKPLFNHVKLAAQLSTLRNKAVEAFALNTAFTAINITKDHKNLRFTTDSIRYNWNLATETLTALGRYRGAQDSLMVKDEETDGVGGGGGFGVGGRGGVGTGRGGAGGRGGANAFAYRNYSPDSTAFVFARNHNLFFVEVGQTDTLQITRSGIEKFSFGGGGGRGGAGMQQQDTTDGGGDQGGRGGRGGESDPANQPSRPNVTWSPDSRAFYLTRTDTRGVKDMYIVRSLTEPRPTLLQYQYDMPGEDSIPRSEVWTYIRGEQQAVRSPINDRWKDQRLLSSGRVGVGGGGGGRGGAGGPPAANQGNWYGKSGTRMRIVRRDRLQRNMEFIEFDAASGETKVLVADSKGDWGSLEPQAPVYIKEGGDFIWFSERDGWGHYYLYANDGTLKRQLTSGEWRSDAIVAIDSLKGLVWFKGVGREPGENPYNQHLYRVSLADASITLLDPGASNHSSVLSKNQRWVFDVSSQVDVPPRVVLRDGLTGKELIDLETTDLSRLEASGWKAPESFKVLAADGVTELWGNMWKPFDFDSTVSYPIIANVYPGPQTESVNSTFSATAGPQQLAQLGFIVVQFGNRGGNPSRSSAYQDFGYFDLRDYALADKKAAIEQLGARYSWIDLDRVGIYGHSGGGFLTAAALLMPPYNEFFKVGVSESGNHDNNIYNSNWSEQYHGLKWVAAADTARLTAEARSKGRNEGEFAAGKAIATAQLNAGRGGGGRGGQNTGVGGRGGMGGRGGRGGAGNGAQGTDTTATQQASAAKPDSVFWIYVPTNIDIAANLKGKLLLETGDEDNNVSPSNTIRLINALIKSNKRFDMMIYPGQAHSFGPMTGYAFQLQAEYFAEFLLGDRSFRMSADFSNHGNVKK